jgi:surface protein
MFGSCRSFNQPINWDTSQVTDMGLMFAYCYIFNSSVTFTDTSKVTQMVGMFSITKFNQPLDFDTSSVTNMSQMFYSCSDFNQPLTNFDTSSVINMYEMFKDSPMFDQNIRTWNVSSSTDLTNMFSGATAMISRYSGVTGFGSADNNYTPTSTFFNITFTPLVDGTDGHGIKTIVAQWIADPTQSIFIDSTHTPYYGHIADWDTSQVTDMSELFKDKTTFNDALTNWDTSSVTNMSYMFRGCSIFNQPLDNWDTSKVTTMFNMFRGCSIFNQPLDNFDTSSVTNCLEVVPISINLLIILIPVK